MLYGMTLQQCAFDYVTCLNRPPNAWNQNYSERTGIVSHYWLIKICEYFGEDHAMGAIDQAFINEQEKRENKK